MKTDEFYGFCLAKIKEQKLPYYTISTHQKIMRNIEEHRKEIKAIFNNLDNVEPNDEEVVTCTALSNLLKGRIGYMQKLIRHMYSDTSTRRVAYADLLRIPGTENYKQVFHYEHNLTPDDKARLRWAKRNIWRCKATGRLAPDTSVDAPVYMLYSSGKPWSFHLIFKSTLIKRIRRLKDADTPLKRFKNRLKYGDDYFDNTDYE